MWVPTRVICKDQGRGILGTYGRERTRRRSSRLCARRGASTGESTPHLNDCIMLSLVRVPTRREKPRRGEAIRRRGDSMFSTAESRATRRDDGGGGQPMHTHVRTCERTHTRKHVRTRARAHARTFKADMRCGSACFIDVYARCDVSECEHSEVRVWVWVRALCARARAPRPRLHL
jgi:hypothetical protein